jgi:hypothetical protein
LYFLQWQASPLLSKKYKGSGYHSKVRFGGTQAVFTGGNSVAAKAVLFPSIPCAKCSCVAIYVTGSLCKKNRVVNKWATTYSQPYFLLFAYLFRYKLIEKGVYHYFLVAAFLGAALLVGAFLAATAFLSKAPGS